MVDYSRAVGWWCPACGMDYDHGGYDAFFCLCLAPAPATRTIPVYDPLPVPEPGASEPDDDTVCLAVGLDGIPPAVRFCMAWDLGKSGDGFEAERWSMSWAGVSWARRSLLDREGEVSTTTSIGSAVLWVAEEGGGA